MTDIEIEILTVFRQEVAEALDELGQIVERLRTGGARPEDVGVALRIAHNVKGAARATGVATVEELAHALEDLLGPYRTTPQAIPALILPRVGRGLSLMQRAAEGRVATEEVEAWLLEHREEGHASTGAVPAAPEPRPAPAAPEPRPSPQVAAAPAEAAASATEAKTTTVRVEVSRLDGLMTHTAELLGIQARLDRRTEVVESLGAALRELRGSLGRAAPIAPILRQVDALLQSDRRERRSFQYLTASFNDAMKRVRMLPLHGAAPQWRRIVRDSAEEAGKEAALQIDVGDIELDKHVLDGLRDPLMHLLRNAVDHGLEAPAARVAAGKPAVGRVSVSAAMVGARVRIEVSDDGRGFDRGVILAKAVARGVLDEERARRLAPEEVTELLFLPGFSTAPQVSRLSGRGIGLDVVRRRLEALGGAVEIARRPRLGGATFYLTVSASLVSTRGLLVRAGGVTYALPIENVTRTLRAEAGAIEHAEGGAALQVAGEDPIRIRWLAALQDRPRDPDRSRLVIVVVQQGGARLGLVVHEIVGEEEFVTKRLPWNLEHVAGVNGVVSLGDGGLAVVLDLPRVIEHASREGRAAGELPRAQDARRTPRILVVDDSVTSRTLERNILSAAGYEVLVAVDGEEGWSILADQPVDLVVSDVEMPKLDGLELTRRIRGHAALKKLPVVLVTSLGSADDLARGAAVGADEYIVKSGFEQRKLLEVVARLL